MNHVKHRTVCAGVHAVRQKSRYWFDILREPPFKKRIFGRHGKSISIVASLVLGSLVLPIAQAKPPHTVQCGDVLGPGGSYRLDEDLYCNVSPALTIYGRTRLNLRGHTLTCGAGLSPIGIQLEGRKVSVANGNILECDRGMVLAGHGKHRVSRINFAHSIPATHVAFVVESDGNLLVHNSATACDWCFYIFGDRNWLIHNLAYDGPGPGFWISGDKNALLHNIADGQVNSGFDISGAENKLARNLAINTIMDNGAAYDMSGHRNELRGNVAIDNDGAGFRVHHGTNNRLVGNVVEDNGQSGITVSGTENKIIRNKAFGNGDGVSSFDLNDDNLNCDNNIWRKNRFETRSDDCIR